MNDRAKGKASTKPRRPAGKAVDYGMLTDLLGYHLRRAQAVVFDDFMRAMADQRITPGQFGVLVMIEANPGISQSALARALGIERSTMVAVLDELERRGLAERRSARHDRRSHALALSEAGGALLADLKPQVRRHEKRIARDLSRDETQQLIALLRRIRKAT
jgi:DNA-binding MarR family transcriptional regulator